MSFWWFYSSKKQFNYIVHNSTLFRPGFAWLINNKLFCALQPSNNLSTQEVTSGMLEKGEGGWYAPLDQGYFSTCASCSSHSFTSPFKPKLTSLIVQIFGTSPFAPAFGAYSTMYTRCFETQSSPGCSCTRRSKFLTHSLSKN